MRILAIIPARGGSKGIPQKNIKNLAQKPLIAWTIEAALNSKFINTTIVSTDSAEIADIAKSHGATIPFMRPAHLATDFASGMAPVFHALEMLPDYDYVVLLQPTSPLRTTADIDHAIQKCMSDHSESCVSVVEAEVHPYLCYSLNENSQLRPVIAVENKNMRRQDMPKAYRLNGAVYVASVPFLNAHKSFIGDSTTGFEMPKSRSVDIDDLFDFEFAEYLLQKQLAHKD